MVLNYKDVLENKTYLEILKNVPEDLIEKINSLEEVKRFQFKEYPAGVITDNTRDHTLRCINLANDINTPGSKDILLRTLWIHDIPELLITDITVIEKYRKESITKKFEEKEIVAAKELLTKDDQKLLHLFNTASNFLKGKKDISLKELPIEFIIAKLIDNAEGNLTFHYYISKWVASKEYNKDKLPPQDSLMHTFITNKKFIEIINKELPKNQSTILIELIEDILNTIKYFWKELPEDKLPSALKEYI